MIFDPPLQQGVLKRRYKRFLADIVLPDGTETTIHCPNTGSMTRCQGKGWRVWFTDSANAKRKYPCTWQLVENEAGAFIGINSALANHLVKEALEEGVISELLGFTSMRSEVPYGEQGSRVDFLLEFSDGHLTRSCYVEVKSLTLGLDDGVGMFPDAVTTRGQKHLQELMAMVEEGHRAVLFFCVQHTGVDRVTVAREIDPAYARLLESAIDKGVEVLVYRAAIHPEANELVLSAPLPFSL